MYKMQMFRKENKIICKADRTMSEFNDRIFLTRRIREVCLDTSLIIFTRSPCTYIY